MNPDKKGIKNPLQLLGLYIAWLESAAAISLLATTTVNHWARHFLIAAAALGIILYIVTACFTVVFLTIKNPFLLFNPSDYDKEAQKLLVGKGIDVQVKDTIDKITISNPDQLDVR